MNDINQATEQTRQNATRQEFELNQQRGDLQSGYDSYIQQAQQGLQRYRQQLQDQAGSQRSELSGSLAPMDVQQGINKFQYNRQSAAPLSGANTDLSQYTPYLNFQSLSGSPQANAFSSFKPQTANKLKPVDQFLGYNPLEQAKKSPTNAFLRG